MEPSGRSHSPSSAATGSQDREQDPDRGFAFTAQTRYQRQKNRSIWMRIEAIAIGNNPPDDINVIIEVPVGGQPIKYEMDKDAGVLVVDRFLYTPMTYPGNYGFVPHTLSDDGDPIDVLVCNTRPLIPGCVINVRPIGVMLMEDNSGQDEKIIAVPTSALTMRYDGVKDYSDMPEITLKQIEHFFEHYKDLEPGKWVKIGGWQKTEVAKRLILEAVDRAKTTEN
jgi:inorganic pyrophosphatase